MKKYIFSTLFAAIALTATAQNAITIERKDGTRFHTSLENFLEVTFTEEAETAFDTDTYPLYDGIDIMYYDNNAYGKTVSMTNVAPHLWLTSFRMEESSSFGCMTALMDNKQETFWIPGDTDEEQGITYFKTNEWIEYSYYTTGTYLFLFNDATGAMRTYRLYDEADVTEKIVEVETRPKSDFTVSINVADSKLDAEYLGSGLWKVMTTVHNGDSFSVTRTDKDGNATQWGASEANATAALAGTINEGSDLTFTLGCDEGRYTIIFDEINGSYALMPAKAELRTLTFEDSDYRGNGNVFGTAKPWSGLIDDRQYGGGLLYGSKAAEYSWNDENNTGLRWDGFSTSYYMTTYACGGYAVSNYVAEPQSNPSYQLSIPFGDGSNNFCVAFNRKDNYASNSVKPIYFGDGKARVIRSIDVTNNSYAAGSLLYGDAFASPAKEGTEFFVNIEGHREDGTTALVRYHLCKDTDILRDKWVTVDCTSLGAVTSIEIYVTGSEDLGGSYGLNTPGYVAFDNIVVEM